MTKHVYPIQADTVRSDTVLTVFFGSSCMNDPLGQPREFREFFSQNLRDFSASYM